MNQLPTEASTVVSQAQSSISIGLSSSDIYFQLRERLEVLHRERVKRASLMRKCKAVIGQHHLEEDDH